MHHKGVLKYVLLVQRLLHTNEFVSVTEVKTKLDEMKFSMCSLKKTPRMKASHIYCVKEVKWPH